ncbi:MAG: hypothetical protein ACRDTA_25930 [Pseudonocardiaceae bacterium]
MHAAGEPTGTLTPTQSGKSRRDLVHKALAAPGALLCSTTKPDLLEFSALARTRAVRGRAGAGLRRHRSGELAGEAALVTDRWLRGSRRRPPPGRTPWSKLPRWSSRAWAATAICSRSRTS